MTKDDNAEELCRALGEIDPAGKDDLSHWAESEAGQRAHARILAQRDGEPEPSPARWKASRVAIAATVAVVLVAVVVTAVVVGTRDSSGEVVKSTTTSGLASSTTTVAPQEDVEQIVALAWVVRAAQATSDTGPQLPGLSPEEDPAAYAEQAQFLGIIGPEETETVVLAGPVSRGTYALWIWRAFQDHLPPVREVDLPDLDPLSTEMQEAVGGVVDAGILDVRADGRFEADQPLTAQEEREARERLWRELGLTRDSESST